MQRLVGMILWAALLFVSTQLCACEPIIPEQDLETKVLRHLSNLSAELAEMRAQLAERDSNILNKMADHQKTTNSIADRIYKMSCYSAGFHQLGRNLCLKFMTESKSWEDARLSCMEIRASLVTIDQADKLSAVVEYVENLFSKNTELRSNVWIGASRDRADNSSFVWDRTGEAVSLDEGWYPGEPNNSQNNEDCVEMTLPWDLRWNDVTCDASRQYICEFSP